MVYAKDSDEILQGCSCGNKLFYFIGDGKKKESTTSVGYATEITVDDDDQGMIVFDTEAVNIIANGKYEIDINALISTPESIVYCYGDGKYSIDISDNPKIRRKK